MGVYIKGMRMPKGCYEPLVTPSYCFLLRSGTCKICHEYANEHDGELSMGYPKGCPLIEIADTPQTDKVVCPNCGRSDYIRSFEKDFNIKNSGYRYKCINCNTYIKDTSQTEGSE